jgi:PBSX family phage terminase large subunit
MYEKGPSQRQAECFQKMDARINILEGAVRSGKSFICLLRFMEELRHGPEGVYVICGKSERTVLHNVISLMQELTEGLVRYNRGLGEFTLFGRKVYVVGANDERAEAKIRGATFAGALVDEATIVPESFFRMLLSRLSVDGAKLFATTNPDSPYHWLKTQFIDREAELDLKVFKFNLEDNPSLSQNYIKALKSEYQGLWYRRFINGEWVLAEGSVYDFFDQKVHCRREPPSYAKYYIAGVDYGTTNPFAAVLVGFNDDVHPAIWIEKEYYWDPKAMNFQKTDTEFAQDLHNIFGQYPVQAYYLDPAAQSFETELKRCRKPVFPAKNDVLDGIRFCASLFTQGDLAICRGPGGHDCRNLIQEIEGYVWDVSSARLGVDKPLKQRDHAVDAMRYALFTHFGTRGTLKEMSRLERHQQTQEKQWQKNPMQYPGFTNSQGWQPAGSTSRVF